MPDGLDSGIGGFDVRPGDHICGVFTDDRQRDELVSAFLEAGLRAGDKCICVVDATDPRAVIDSLDRDIDAQVRADEKQLEVMRAADAYLRSGRFSPAETVGFWKSAISDVMYDGRFDAVRAVEIWSLRDVVPETDELMALEVEMNQFLPLYPQVILCLYDLGRFGGGILVDLLRTHPKVLLGGMVIENPHFLPPEAFVAGLADSAPEIPTEDIEVLIHGVGP
jgi:hypothetical protein